MPIRECGEKMLPIPADIFCLSIPYVYEAWSDGTSPWMLRESVLASLIAAQKRLEAIKPGWKIKIADAYRTLEITKKLAKREMQKTAKAMGLDFENLSEEEFLKVEEKALNLFSIPTDDPSTPPLHSTGAAFDCSLVDETGKEPDLKGRSEEFPQTSAPDFFANAADPRFKQVHALRTLLRTILEAEGFTQHPKEWWHFSKDDQYAALIKKQRAIENNIPIKESDYVSIYGRADLL